MQTYFSNDKKEPCSPEKGITELHGRFTIIKIEGKRFS